MTAGAPAAPSACWNCRQPLQSGASRCIWCGVPQRQDAAPLVVAPGAPPPGPALVAPAPVVAPAPPIFAAPVAVAPSLGPQFHGSVAGTGPRVVAFTVDVILVGIVVTAAFLLSGSPVVTVAVLLEALLLLWILDARTGATVGKALLQLRTSRADTPASPGAGASLARGLVHGAGFLVGVAGAWVVAASSAFDRSRRGWPDRLTRTVVVAVPARARVLSPTLAAAPSPLAAASPAPAVALAPALAVPAAPPLVPTAPPLSPAATVAPPAQPVAPIQPPAPAVLAEPRVVNLAPPRSPVDEESASAARTDAPPAFGSVTVTPADDQPASGRGVELPTGAEASLLLVFDTGQREQLPAPVAVNLGRNPVASVAGDRLIAVQDPESTVSKTHARLEHSRGSTWITDGGSTNGSEIISDEGVVTPLERGVPTLLEEGSRVRLGRRVFTVSVVLGGGGS